MIPVDPARHDPCWPARYDPCWRHYPSQRHCDRARSGREAIHHVQRGLPRPSDVIKCWIAARRAACSRPYPLPASLRPRAKRAGSNPSRATWFAAPLRRHQVLDCRAACRLFASIPPPSVIATAREAGGKQSITRNVVCRAIQTSSSAGLPRGVPPLAMTGKG